MTYTYSYPRAAVTVDIAVFTKLEQKWSILLIQRGNPPFVNCWALPGGFIEMDEKLVESALRELKEETGLTGVDLTQFRTYGDPGRDPRGRSVSVVFFGFVNPSNTNVKGADDAKDAGWYLLDELPEMAFDHQLIVKELIQILKHENKLS
nr:NUDIX hydrolase [Bacteroidota bacterium]